MHHACFQRAHLDGDLPMSPGGLQYLSPSFESRPSPAPGGGASCRRFHLLDAVVRELEECASERATIPAAVVQEALAALRAREQDQEVDISVSIGGRAAAFYAEHGIHAKAILTDNGPAYRSGASNAHLAEAHVKHNSTRAYRPQTNGKVERFNRTLLEEWAYVRPYTSNSARTRTLKGFLHKYNYHRAHSALGGKTPIERVNNVCGHYT